MASSCGMGVPQFYAGKHVFVTGATGFMGKVLVERLLSTCPDVGRVFLLMRTKQGQEPAQRLEMLKQCKAFDNLRDSSPAQLNKLRCVPGDGMLPALGISEDSMLELRQVSVVFHSAATVRFNEELEVAVQQNVLAVVRLMEICDRLPSVQAFVHVSTAYSHPELSYIEEKVYPPPVPLEQLLELVAKGSPLLKDVEKFIYPKPNTYSFTKAVAESAIQEHGCRAYPIAIIRPSIVISSMQHPFPGWLENTNGPSGVIVGIGRGLLRFFRCRESAVADLMPVDIAIDAMLAAAWEVAVDRPPSPRVYNCSSCDNPTTWGHLRGAFLHHARAQPQLGAMWYPNFQLIKNGFLYKIMEVMLQTVPLYLAEYVTRVLGLKQRVNLIRVSKQLQDMQNVYSYFAMREWGFDTGNVKQLSRRLCEADRTVFNLDPRTIDWDQQYSDFVRGVRLYLLKETEDDQPAAKRRMKKLRLLYYGLSVCVPALIFRILLERNHSEDFLKLLYLLISTFNAVCVRTTKNFLYFYNVSVKYFD